MSTRCSLAYGDNFHLFTDLMDLDNTVHLTIDCCGKHEHSISIPPEIWNTIIKVGPVDAHLVDVSDEKILKIATTRVDAFRKNTKKNKNMLSLVGFQFGPSPNRKSQIQHVVDNLTKERARQIEIVNKSTKHQLCLTGHSL